MVFPKKVREENHGNRDGGNNGACGSISHRRHGRDCKIEMQHDEDGRGFEHCLLVGFSRFHYTLKSCEGRGLHGQINHWYSFVNGDSSYFGTLYAWSNHVPPITK